MHAIPLGHRNSFNAYASRGEVLFRRADSDKHCGADEMTKKSTRTKIVCTIGPASRSKETLAKMIGAGMDVARLNLSHDTHSTHKKTFDVIRSVDPYSIGTRMRLVSKSRVRLNSESSRIP